MLYCTILYNIILYYTTIIIYPGHMCIRPFFGHAARAAKGWHRAIMRAAAAQQKSAGIYFPLATIQETYRRQTKNKTAVLLIGPGLLNGFK